MRGDIDMQSSGRRRPPGGPRSARPKDLQPPERRRAAGRPAPALRSCRTEGVGYHAERTALLELVAGAVDGADARSRSGGSAASTSRLFPPAPPSSSRIPLRPSRAVARSVVMSASTSSRPTSGAARLALNSLVVPPVAAAGDGRQSPAHGDERQGTHAPVAGASSLPCSFRTSPLRVFARVPPYGAWGYPNGGGRQG